MRVPLQGRRKATALLVALAASALAVVGWGAAVRKSAGLGRLTGSAGGSSSPNQVTVRP
jgi:hypothetical protein